MTGLRRRPLSAVRREQVADLVGLADLLDLAGGLPVALHVSDTATFELICGLLRTRPVGAPVWCRHPELDELARWRAIAPDVRLVNTVRIPKLNGGPERRAADLRSAGVEAVEAPARDWTSGHVVLFQRFGRQSWASEAVHEPAITEVLTMGIDSVSGPHVGRLVDVAASMA